MLVLGFPEYVPQSQALAKELSAPWEEVEIHQFPDGESRVRLPTVLPSRVVFCRSLHRPNDKLIELFFAAQAARQSGVRHLILVAPYLCYMRQDAAFRPGEVISQTILGGVLANLFDAVITVDPHLHRTHSLREAVPAKHALALSAAPKIAEFLADHAKDSFLLGPDEESEQWVKAIARPHGFHYAVASKVRHGDCDVQITIPDTMKDIKRVVIIDDVTSTGCTLAEMAAVLQMAGTIQIDALVTHALFAEGSLERLHRVGIHHVWSTDSIDHSSNVIALADLLANGVQEVLKTSDI